jgi:3-phosphoshikimate 1-carboxyvinyltransferase
MFSTAFLDLPALQSAQGSVQLPGSKSISNRVLLLAALSRGTTTVHDLLASDDTRVMLDALRQLGCGVEQDGAQARITGLGGRQPTSPATLFLGNAGTAMRPLTAALALLGGVFELSGVARMHERPIGDLVDALRQLGCQIDYLGNEGYPPLRIAQADGVPALALSTPIRVRGDVSSQFLTALLMALPLAATQQDVVIEVVGELISKPYIHITLQLLERFGITVRHDHWQRFTIPAGSSYQSPGSIHVEADASSASYFIAAGAIAAGDGVQKWHQNSGCRDGFHPGRHPLCRSRPSHGCADHRRPQLVADPARRLAAQGHRPGLQPYSRCSHDAGRDGAVRPGHHHLAQHCQLACQGNRPHCGHGHRTAQARRHRGGRGGLDSDHTTRCTVRLACRQHPHLRRPPRRHVLLAGSLQPGRPAGAHPEDPQCVAKTFPDYFEALFSVSQAAPAQIPVICIDGPTASGKGTVAAAVAQRLGYGFLDSGAMYRITALAATRAGCPLTPATQAAIADLARQLPVRFEADQRVWLGGEDVTEAIRTEEAGMNASRVSALPAVRTALVDLQHSFRRLPGLVADGRDMGTVIFPDAALKVFSPPAQPAAPSGATSS